jgi:hypothetical protein
VLQRNCDEETGALVEHPVETSSLEKTDRLLLILKNIYQSAGRKTLGFLPGP